jgi:hypothetical protein
MKNSKRILRRPSLSPLFVGFLTASIVLAQPSERSKVDPIPPGNATRVCIATPMPSTLGGKIPKVKDGVESEKTTGGRCLAGCGVGIHGPLTVNGRPTIILKLSMK